MVALPEGGGPLFVVGEVARAAEDEGEEDECDGGYQGGEAEEGYQEDLPGSEVV